MQPPGGIDDHRVGAAGACGLDGVERNRTGIGAWSMGDDLDLCPLPPEVLLLDRGGAIGVGGRQQRAAAFAPKQGRQLSDGGRLA